MNTADKLLTQIKEDREIRAKADRMLRGEKFQIRGMSDFQKMGVYLLAGIHTQSGCIEHRQKNTTYGAVNLSGRTMRMHRASYQTFVGPIGGIQVCHKCDNPRCFNPDHLFLGTSKENMVDASKKGRQFLQKNPQAAELVRKKGFGESSPRATLTQDQVRDVRRRLVRGQTNAFIAR